MLVYSLSLARRVVVLLKVQETKRELSAESHIELCYDSRVIYCHAPSAVRFVDVRL